MQPVVTDGHLAQARSVGSGEYWLSLNQYVNLTMNVKLAGGPIDYFVLDPVALFFGAVGVSAKAPHPEHRAAGGELHAEQGMRDVPRQVRPHPDPRRRRVQSAAASSRR